MKLLRSKPVRCITPALLILLCQLAMYFVFDIIYEVFFKASYASFDDFEAECGAFISIAAVLVAIVFLYKIFKNDQVFESPFIRKHGIYFLPIILLGAFASHALSILVSLMQIDGILGSYGSAGAYSALGFALAVFRSALIVPLAEELAFRGLIFTRLRIYTQHFWPAALICSVLFGIYHLNLAQGVYAFLYGIILCFVYEKFRSILASFALHASANLTSLILNQVGVSYASVHVYVIVMICCAGAGVLLALLMRKVES